MKRNSLRTILVMLTFLVACNEPQTTVTNILHLDGSVSRVIEMRSSKDNISYENMVVPYDSTWVITDTIEVNNEKDTTWIRKAEKLFSDASEITDSYSTEHGLNSKISRHTSFKRKFRWFHTVIRFSEIIDKTFKSGYPLEDFMKKEYLDFFYLPDFVHNEMESGSDSLKYRQLDDSVTAVSDEWTWVALMSEWISEFTNLTVTYNDPAIGKEKLKMREKEKLNLNDDESEEDFIKFIIGAENYKKYRVEADSAIAVVLDRWDPNLSFSRYNVKFVMPGKLIGTNGYLLERGGLMWPVRSEFFLTADHEMWAESKITNWWAWIISGTFLIFVVTGLILKMFRR